MLDSKNVVEVGDLVSYLVQTTGSGNLKREERATVINITPHRVTVRLSDSRGKILKKVMRHEKITLVKKGG